MWIGTILAFFYSFRKHLFSKLCLKSKKERFDIEEAHNFNMRMEIPSCPWALFGSKDLIILVFSSLEISKDEILSVVSKTKSLGRLLSFSIVLHCWVKNSLSKFAFSKKLVTSCSLTKIWSNVMSYYKRKILSKNFTETVTWKLIPGTFVFAKN